MEEVSTKQQKVDFLLSGMIQNFIKRIGRVVEANYVSFLLPKVRV